ncbi:YdeI/OmpD-associated family protein [Terrisporobacter hibernicus]|uniref:YdeI/OmpD-associated family protein n=2 Tax=Terrisporobacter hibernicus TaxID=2813371 RepID=A0AAX2ZNH9_9FIRM|nr:YdeI/OmpD-associated family protein [Terrisporobacter hibernicus]UEL49845.1 YdeI/OmpD-associated family protein [Terrisporobacter hibernicus]
MEVTNLLDIKNRDELRKWLDENHKIEKECWVIVKRGKPKNDEVFWYLDAVEEAMCFGWIDSTCKKVDDGLTAQRLSPRRKNSSWTELNKERCRRLEKMGKMTKAGRDILPDMSIAYFKIDEKIIDSIKENPIVYKNYKSFPSLYQRVRIDTIQAYKKQPEVFNKRLKKFIENTEKGVMYGEWDDNGRLLEY